MGSDFPPGFSRPRNQSAHGSRTPSSGKPKEIRILTKKTTGKPKGCAFVEWESSEHQMVGRNGSSGEVSTALAFTSLTPLNAPAFLHPCQRALLFHHRKLKDKKINVELTAGGGGSVS
jgi:hypothetical protein